LVIEEFLNPNEHVPPYNAYVYSPTNTFDAQLYVYKNAFVISSSHVIPSDENNDAVVP